MSLPGNNIPEEALPPGGTSTPAGDADVMPVYCRHSVRWSWVGDQGGFICDDPEHHMSDSAYTTADRRLQAEAIQDHARRITGW